jgi:hypothetical protein
METTELKLKFKVNPAKLIETIIETISEVSLIESKVARCLSTKFD